MSGDLPIYDVFIIQLAALHCFFVCAYRTYTVVNVKIGAIDDLDEKLLFTFRCVIGDDTKVISL